MNEKKNILVWSPFTSKVGTTNNIINIVNSFNKYSNFDLSLINVYGEWDNYIEKFRTDRGNRKTLISLNFLKNFKKEGFLKSRLLSIMIFFFSFRPLLNLIKIRKPDFFIVHLITSLPLLVFLIFNLKPKLILHIAGHPKLNFIRKNIWRLTSKKIFKIICPSNELKEYLIKQNIFETDKIIVVEDCHLEIKKINIFSKKDLNENFLDDNKILISIGRLTKQKNFQFLIKNFADLLRKFKDLKLLIIGEGEEKQGLENLIKNLGINDKVKLIGFDKNIYNYLGKSNFFISTSKWEGSSLSMIDAAYMGIPILCSDCPSGRKEFIGKDQRGFIYKEGDALDFQKKFNLMYNMNKNEIYKCLVNAKNHSKKFSVFRSYLKLRNILI